MNEEQKAYNLMLKQAFIENEYKILRETYEEACSEYENITLLCFINDLLERERSFYYLSDTITYKIENIFYLIKENNKDKSIIPAINEMTIGFNIINNESVEEKYKNLSAYLKDNFYLRSGNNTYYKSNDINKLKKYSIATHSFDYIFYQSTKKQNFDIFLQNDILLEFIFSLNYMTEYMPELFTSDNRKLYLDTLDKIQSRDKKTKKYVKSAKKNIKKIY